MDEKRSAPRLAPYRTVVGRVSDFVGTQSLGAIVQDVSPHGIGLILTRPLTLPGFMYIELPGWKECVPARLIHNREQDDGTFQAGFQFIEPVEEENLRRFVETGEKMPREL